MPGIYFFEDGLNISPDARCGADVFTWMRTKSLLPTAESKHWKSNGWYCSTVGFQGKGKRLNFILEKGSLGGNKLRSVLLGPQKSSYLQ